MASWQKAVKFSRETSHMVCIVQTVLLIVMLICCGCVLCSHCVYVHTKLVHLYVLFIGFSLQYLPIEMNCSMVLPVTSIGHNGA